MLLRLGEALANILVWGMLIIVVLALIGGAIEKSKSTQHPVQEVPVESTRA